MPEEASAATPSPRRRGGRRSAAEAQRSDGSGEQESRVNGEATASQAKASQAAPERRLPRLLVHYREQVFPALMQEFGYRNVMQAPRLQKVVLNVGLGEALTNNRAIEAATGDLTAITGQKPVVTRARESIAGFKVREGQSIGTSVTLRGDRMYIFVDKLFNVALPRSRDFRGVSRSAFDGRGNYSLGLREQTIFPEIDYNQIDKMRGLQINFVTSAGSDREALRLLELLGAPFARSETTGDGKG